LYFLTLAVRETQVLNFKHFSGHGIPDEEGDSSVKITVVDKIDGVELGWALGAMFHEMGKLAAKASKP